MLKGLTTQGEHAAHKSHGEEDDHKKAKAAEDEDSTAKDEDTTAKDEDTKAKDKEHKKASGTGRGSKNKKKVDDTPYHGNHGWDLDDGTDAYQHGGSAGAKKGEKNDDKAEHRSTHRGDASSDIKWPDFKPPKITPPSWPKIPNDLFNMGNIKHSSSKSTIDDDDSADASTTEKSDDDTHEFDLFDG